MTELQFSLPVNFVGCFVTDENIEIGAQERLLFEAYVPGIEFVSDYSRFDVTIEHKESDRQRMIVKENSITIYDQWNGKLSYDVYHLLSGIARQHYLKYNLFSVHAACIDLDNLVLIAGHSRSGKTAISLELLIKAGIKIYSGNKTVVNLAGKRPKAVAGTKIMTSKIKDLRDEFQGVQYGDRVAFRLNDFQYAESGSIGAVVLVHLNDGEEEWKKLTPMNALHNLYPYFLDTVNADVVIGNDVFDGSISIDSKEYLVDRLGQILQQTQVYSAIGSLQFICENIERMKK